MYCYEVRKLLYEVGECQVNLSSCPRGCMVDVTTICSINKRNTLAEFRLLNG